MKDLFKILHRYFGTFVCSIFIMCLFSCDKVPMNGDLDGMWKLTSIQVLSDVRDTREPATFMCIQLHLTEWRRERAQYFSHFTHEGDSLFFYDFAHASLHRSQADDNKWITAAEMESGQMDAWGIHNLDARYKVRELDGEALVLQKNDTILFFKKF